MYTTTCLHCGKEGSLQVISMGVTCAIPLRKEGFSSDAALFDTVDEIVRCSHCEKQFDLSDLRRQ